MKWMAATIVTVLVFAPVGEAWAKEYKIQIVEVKYKPAKLSIKKGDKVVWINSDDRDHTVVAKDESFDSGKIAAGEKFEFTFKEAGKYEFGCDYHPRMKGIIEVTE